MRLIDYVILNQKWALIILLKSENINLVPDSYVAWHAGKSRWGKFNSLNKYSIGIEIQNSGHDNNYENFL